MTRLFFLVRYIVKTLLPALPFLHSFKAQAQDIDDDAVSKPLSPSLDDMLDEDSAPGFNLSYYTEEIVMLVVLAIIIAIVRNSVQKKHRNGCTFFIIVFAILYYIYMMYFD